MERTTSKVSLAVKLRIATEYLKTPGGRHKVYISIFKSFEERVIAARRHVPGVSTYFQIIPEDAFWEMVEVTATIEGLPLAGAFCGLVDEDVDLSRNPPHPFLQEVA